MPLTEMQPENAVNPVKTESLCGTSRHTEAFKTS